MDLLLVEKFPQRHGQQFAPFTGLSRKPDPVDQPVLAPLHPGIEQKALYEEPGFAEAMRLERWSAGAAPGPASYAGGVEILVLRGEFEDEQGTYAPLTWLRLPPGGSHRPRSREGCELYVRRGNPFE